MNARKIHAPPNLLTASSTTVDQIQRFATHGRFGLKQVEVPLIYELPDGRVDQAGTCALFRDRQENVLLTTPRHTFESDGCAASAAAYSPGFGRQFSRSWKLKHTFDPQFLDCHSYEQQLISLAVACGGIQRSLL